MTDKEIRQVADDIDTQLGTSWVSVTQFVEAKRMGDTAHVLIQSTRPGGEGFIVVGEESLLPLSKLLMVLHQHRTQEEKDVPKK